MVVTTIDELAHELGLLGERFAAGGSRLGYFASLYGLMTGRVADGLAAGRFEDGARMQRMACHFAARYLAALERFEAGEATPASWRVAFEAARRWRPIILQHLFLGMNAHINFDLGIAAAEIADQDELATVEHDFNEINAVLAELLGDVQARLGRVSPWMGILDVVGGRKDEAVVNFSMQHARSAAWEVATTFAPMSREERMRAESELDARVAKFARVILWPGPMLSVACLPVRLRESAPPIEVIAALRGG